MRPIWTCLLPATLAAVVCSLAAGCANRMHRTTHEDPAAPPPGPAPTGEVNELVPPTLGSARDDAKVVLARRFEPGRTWRYESDGRFISEVMGRQSVMTSREFQSIQELPTSLPGEAAFRIEFDPRSRMESDGTAIRSEYVGRSMVVRRAPSGALSLETPPDLPNLRGVFEATGKLHGSPPLYLQDAPGPVGIGDRWRVQRRVIVEGNPEPVDCDISASLDRLHASPEGVIAVVSYSGTSVMGAVRSEIRGTALWNVDHGQLAFDDAHLEMSGQVSGQSMRMSSTMKCRMTHVPGGSGGPASR